MERHLEATLPLWPTHRHQKTSERRLEVALRKGSKSELSAALAALRLASRSSSKWLEREEAAKKENK